MQDKVEAFFEGIKGKRIALVGLGVSHTQLAGLLAEKGAQVTVWDRKSRQQLGPAVEELERKGVAFELGSDDLSQLECDILLRTPGMYYYRPELTALREAGVAVTSEMELFFDLCPCPIIAVTGSDGKTTTTTLIAEMLRAQGKTVHLGGNIGRALLPIVEQVRPDDWAVVELSSFQLISMRKSPAIAVITNLAPNHLDVHKSMEEYIDAKKNLFAHQGAFGTCVLNLDNPITAAFAAETRGAVRFFSRREKPRIGAYMDAEGEIFYRARSGEHRVMHRSEIRLPGLHNVENYLAALSAVWGLVEPEKIRQVAREFGGVEHRIEFVRELDGVKWYNDSIATSPTRTIAGLDSFDQKLVLIAGGYDKKIPFEPLAPKLLEKVRLLILTGLTAPKIEAAVRACPGFAEAGLEILHAADLPEAVALARREARQGDIVSLSPACASFDQYPNFEARGNHFKALVQAME